MKNGEPGEGSEKYEKDETIGGEERGGGKIVRKATFQTVKTQFFSIPNLLY